MKDIVQEVQLEARIDGAKARLKALKAMPPICYGLHPAMLAFVENGPSDVEFLLTSLEEAQFIALGFEFERDVALERVRVLEEAPNA